MHSSTWGTPRHPAAGSQGTFHMSTGSPAPDIIHMGYCAELVYRACPVCKKSRLSMQQVVGDHLGYHLESASC